MTAAILSNVMMKPINVPLSAVSARTLSRKTGTNVVQRPAQADREEPEPKSERARIVELPGHDCFDSSSCILTANDTSLVMIASTPDASMRRMSAGPSQVHAFTCTPAAWAPATNSGNTVK